MLDRCVNCNTQNANESLHSVIWNKCPKEKFAGKDRIKSAAAVAISEFNFGCKETVICIQKELGISIRNQQIMEKRDRRRLIQNDSKSTLNYKKNRKKKVMTKLNNENARSKRDKESYQAEGY